MSSIKELMDKVYQVDPEKIGKMASVDIASGGILPLPEKGESINIKFISPPKHVANEKLPNAEGAFTARCILYGQDEGLQYDVWLSSTIHKGILAEFQKNKTDIDKDMKCMIGRVFTISGREWSKAPKEIWSINEMTGRLEPPKTYGISLRLDLEAKEAAGIIPGSIRPEGTAPDLFEI